MPICGKEDPQLEKDSLGTRNHHTSSQDTVKFEEVLEVDVKPVAGFPNLSPSSYLAKAIIPLKHVSKEESHI